MEVKLGVVAVRRISADPVRASVVVFVVTY